MKFLDANWMHQLDRAHEREDRAAQWRAKNPDLARAHAVSEACVAPAVAVHESNSEVAWSLWDRAWEQLSKEGFNCERA